MRVVKTNSHELMKVFLYVSLYRFEKEYNQPKSSLGFGKLSKFGFIVVHVQRCIICILKVQYNTVTISPFAVYTGKAADLICRHTRRCWLRTRVLAGIFGLITVHMTFS